MRKINANKKDIINLKEYIKSKNKEFISILTIVLVINLSINVYTFVKYITINTQINSEFSDVQDKKVVMPINIDTATIIDVNEFIIETNKGFVEIPEDMELNIKFNKGMQVLVYKDLNGKIQLIDTINYENSMYDGIFAYTTDDYELKDGEVQIDDEYNRIVYKKYMELSRQQQKYDRRLFIVTILTCIYCTTVIFVFVRNKFKIKSSNENNFGANDMLDGDIKQKEVIIERQGIGADGKELGGVELDVEDIIASETGNFTGRIDKRK